MKGREAIHVFGRGVAGRQGQQLAYKVGVAGLHCQVQRCVPLLLLGACAVQQLGHCLHMPVLGCQLQCCEALGILHANMGATQKEGHQPAMRGCYGLGRMLL